MKFAQFVELDETLESNGYNIEDLKEELQKDGDSDVLFEFFGINKALVSWGVSGIMKSKLDKQAKKFTVEVGEVIKKNIDQLVRSKRKVSAEIEELQNSGNPVSANVANQIGQIEARIIKNVNSDIDRLSKQKTEVIEQRIDQSRGLKPSAKLALNYFWTKLMSEAKVILLTYLMKSKVIESKEGLGAIKKFARKEEERMKNQAKDVNKDIKEKKETETSSKKSEDKKEPKEGEKTGSEL